MKIWTPFPLDDKPTTQQLVHEKEYGAIISAAPKKVWGFTPSKDAYGNMPIYKILDKQLAQAHTLDIHIHPLIARTKVGVKQDFERLNGRVHELGMPVVDRYADRINRWTLAQELCLCKPQLWDEIVDFYKAVRKKYPDLEIWVGDYAIRNPLDRDGILTRIADLQGIAVGFVGADYVDLSNKKNPITQWMKVNALGKVSTRRFSYLIPFWKQLRSMGFTKLALEHSTFATEDTPLIRSAQQGIYNDLLALCRRHDVDYWMWNLCDEVTQSFMDTRTYSSPYYADASVRLELE